VRRSLATQIPRVLMWLSMIVDSRSYSLHNISSNMRLYGHHRMVSLKRGCSVTSMHL
jgi:hypothetical protein